MRTTQAGMRGHAPTVKIEPTKKEYSINGKDVAKLVGGAPSEEERTYVKCWKDDRYRNFSPGEQQVPQFLEFSESHRKPCHTIIDWGCGTGRGGYKLYQEGYDVTLVDFAINCLDDNIAAECVDNDSLRFQKHDLTKPSTLKSEFGFCCDVMEHVPEDQVDDVLDNILNSSRHVYFQICTKPDHFGKLIEGVGHLHVTVKPYRWWLHKLIEQEVIIHRSEVNENWVVFYVTGFGEQSFDFSKGTVNTADEEIIANMKANAKLGLQQVKPHEEQDTTIMLLAGGPSLNDFEDEIIKQRAEGMKCVTVNGAYNWAMERGLAPITQIMIDAREHNHRFVTPVNKDNLYLIASQCNPKVLEKLPKDRTLLWQVSLSDELLPHIKELYGKMYEDWFPCPGGSTSTLRALCLLRMLGFNRIIVYGLDSCLLDDEHHAYPQPENDDDRIIDLTLAEGTKYEKTFKCTTWHVMQLKDFEGMVPRVLKDCQLWVKGDGAIAHLIEANAALLDTPIDGIEAKELGNS